MKELQKQISRTPQTPFYIFSTVSRSFDTYHNKGQGNNNKNLMHLIFSNFYTHENRIPWAIENMERLGVNRIQHSLQHTQLTNPLIIVKITSEDVRNVKEVFHSNINIIELEIPYFYIFSAGAENIDGKPIFSEVLDALFGKPSQVRKDFDEIYVDYRGIISQIRDRFYSYKSLLLVFENLSWNNIQVLFRSFKVTVSGGSSTKRNVLSTSEFLLSQHLLSMKYNIQHIWKSKRIEAYIKKNQYFDCDRNLEITLNVVKNLITKDLIKKIEELSFEIKYFNEIQIKLKSLKASGTTKIVDPLDPILWPDLGLNSFYISQHFPEFDSIRSLSVPDINIFIDSIFKAIPIMETQLRQTQLSLEKVNSLNADGKVDYYYKYIHNSRVEAGNYTINKFVKRVNESNLLNKPINFLRKYCTLARRNIISNKVFHNPFPCKAIYTAPSFVKSGLINELTGPIETGQPKNKTNEKGIVSIENKTSKNTEGIDSATSFSYIIDSPIFWKLQEIINNDYDNKSKQLEIENFLKNQALVIANYKLEGPQQKYLNSPDNSIIIKLDEMLPRLIKVIENHKNKIISEHKTELKKYKEKELHLAHKIFISLDTHFLTVIVYGRLINIISNNHLLNKKTLPAEVAIDLGSEMVKKYLYKKYAKLRERPLADPNLTFSQWKEDNNKFPEIMNSQVEFDLGNILTNFMVYLKLIKLLIKKINRKENLSIFVAGEVIEKEVPELNNSFRINAIPNRIPMVCPPIQYSYKEGKIKKYGGYLLNGKEYYDEIILSNRELSLDPILMENNVIVNMVNKINSVAFKINENVLDFILYNNKNYKFFTDFKDVHPLSLKNKLNLSEKKTLLAFNSRKHLELNILGLANIFRFVPAIYFPVRLDYRGRLYCTTEYLNYQGIELAKGLLEFSKGEIVEINNKEAIEYLKIFGANCFGNKLEKKSFKARIEWVESNEQDILKFENGVLLSQAENKTIFLSFCFEYRKYLEALNNNSQYFVTNLPIQLDASCNGFQHLTMLVDDLSLAKKLNLTKVSKDEDPQDFYMFIGFRVKQYFIKKLKKFEVGELELTPKELESYSKLSELDFFRNLIKRAIMTIPYNASALSIVDYLKESFDQKKNPEWSCVSNKSLKELESKETEYKVNKDYYIYVLKSDVASREKTRKGLTFKEIDFQSLRKALNHSIFNDYPRLGHLAKYLRGIANVANRLDINIPWFLPTGLNVNQRYYKTITIKIKPFPYSKNIINLSVLNKKEFNTNKQKIALMPNLIHSLDAASLCLVTYTYFKDLDNINFFSIHDCFAVPCNKVKLLTSLLQHSYCWLYSDSKYLLNFDKNFRDDIINTFGKESVSFNDEKGKVTIKLKHETIETDFPSISLVIEDKESKIDVTNSLYILL